LAVWRCPFIGRYLLGQVRRCAVTCRKNRAMAHFNKGAQDFAFAQDDNRGFTDDKCQRRQPTKSSARLPIRRGNWYESLILQPSNLHESVQEL
jgi:hypothetical protein